MHHIVVAGGGAAGLELVTKLGDKFGAKGLAQVTLVERNRAHIWKPLLHSLAAGSLSRSEHELNYLAQAHWHHFTYRFGEVVGLDRDTKQLHLGPVMDDEGRQITAAVSLDYDTLVMSIGSITNDFGTPGAAEFAVPLETPDQANRFNRRLINACLRANGQDGPIRPASCMSPSSAPGRPEPSWPPSCIGPFAPSSPMGSTASSRSGTSASS